MSRAQRKPKRSARDVSVGGWIAYWNGRLVPDEEIHISPWDRGFVLGDAAYEVTRTYHHVPFHLDWHLDRLFSSLQYLQIDPPLTKEQLTDLTLTVLARNIPRLGSQDDVSITHRITRGVFAGLFAGRPTTPPTVLIICRPVTSAQFATFYQSGIELKTPSLRLPAAGGIEPRAKTQSRLHHVLGDVEMWPSGRDVLPLFADVEGYVTESVASNVFFVKGNRLLTPPDHAVLGGVTRRLLLQLAEEIHLEVLRRPVHLAELQGIDEAFITGTSFAILPVRRINSRDLQPVPGPVTSALTAAFGRHAGVDIVERSRTPA